jgi:hypothetical protein
MRAPIAVDIIAGVEAHFGHADAAERLFAQKTLQDEAQRSQMGTFVAHRALERDDKTRTRLR